MRFTDLSDQHIKIKNSLYKGIKKLFNHHKYILGPEIYELEKKLSKYTGSKYVVSCSSGTDAILMSLMALDVKKGDEIITSPFTWMSNVEMIKLLGAKPIYADICLETFNILPQEVEKKITKKTKAILPISLFGQTADFKKINSIAKKFKIKVIEDAAQSFGAMHHGKYSCNLSDIGTTSFFPTKPLGCYGDGGACFTNNRELYDKLKLIRNHGQKKKGENICIGLNARLDTLQAVVLNSKIKILKRELNLRNKVALRYTNELRKLNYISVPKILSFNKSVYAQYSILCKNRSLVIKKFKKDKIPFSIFYKKPIYRQKAYFVKNMYLKNTEFVCGKILSLPFYPYLKTNIQKKIIDSISNINYD